MPHENQSYFQQTLQQKTCLTFSCKLFQLFAFIGKPVGNDLGGDLLAFCQHPTGWHTYRETSHLVAHGRLASELVLIYQANVPQQHILTVGDSQTYLECLALIYTWQKFDRYFLN